MPRAKRPSFITLPADDKAFNSLLDFLLFKFPHIDKNIWVERMTSAKMHWHEGNVIDLNTAFIARKKLCYYREVKNEPTVPFEHNIIFQNEHLLVADKPHFLPVTPGGQYVNECLLERLRIETNNSDIVPLHRLDRETAGLVLFSLKKDTRGIYSQLFEKQQINKRYLAVAKLDGKTLSTSNHWCINNRLVKSSPAFLMKEIEGESNASSSIKLIGKNDEYGCFELTPETGKTHQLRLHMMKINMPILNDKFYPQLLAQVDAKGDFSINSFVYQSPLQLLAKSLNFTDPISRQHYYFESSRNLSDWFVESTTSL